MTKKHYGFHGDKQMDISQEEIKDNSMRILEEGNIILVVSEHEGQVAINVMGKPSEAVLNILESVYVAYRKILHGEEQ